MVPSAPRTTIKPKAAASQPEADADNYYMVVFASQSSPPVPRMSHTFACFIKADDGPDVQKIVETVTISWLPKSLNIVVGRLLPEDGVNLELTPTLKWIAQRRTSVTAWGPYRIKKELYERAVKQKSRLESGSVLYRAIDFKALGTRGDVSNCIHAVGDLGANGTLVTGVAHGETASAMVVGHLRPWIVDAKETHPWVSEKLDLKKFTIRFQE